MANVICALLFGERYSHNDKEFEKLRKCVNDAFRLIDEDYEIDFIPLIKYLPHYRRKLGITAFMKIFYVAW